jgi:hypothetical protein
MDDENRIDEAWQPVQKVQETTEARMQQASEFWSKYEDDTLPSVLQTFKVRAVAFVQALPDAALENEEAEYLLPRQLEDRAGEVGMTPSLKERLWQRVFADERNRRGIADPNDYADLLDDEPGADVPVDATPDPVGEAPHEPTGRAAEEEFPDDPAVQ